MRIDRFDVYQVAMPLIYPWRTAYGSDSNCHSVFVKATSGEYESWAESSPLCFGPLYMPETATSAFYNITEFFAPHVVGLDYDTADDLNQRLEIFKGNNFAKAAIEMSWWSLRSTMTEIPLHRLLGGQSREVEVGADFGIQDSIDMLLSNIQNAVESNSLRVKLKISKGWDLDVLRAVRNAFPNIILHIDCNAGYTLDDLPFFKAIDDMNLAFIEQPLQYFDVLDHAKLARQIQTPICLDETIVGVKIAEQAIQEKACKYINIKPGRVGGLTNAVAIHDLAEQHGVAVWVGGMLESALGSSICVELATLSNFRYPGDIFPSSRFYLEDLSEPVLELTPRNTFKPLNSPLPKPNLQRLSELTVRSKSIVNK